MATPPSRLCINFIVLTLWILTFLLGAYYLTGNSSTGTNLRRPSSVVKGASVSEPLSRQLVDAESYLRGLEAESVNRSARATTEKKEREWLLHSLNEKNRQLELERQRHHVLKLKYELLQNDYDWLKREDKMHESLPPNAKSKSFDTAAKMAHHPKDITFVPTNTKPPTDPAIFNSTWPPHDPRQLARLRLSADIDFPPKQPSELCKEQLENGLVQGLNQDIDKDLLDHITVLPDNEDGQSLLCLLYTTEAKHIDGPTSSRNTWGSRCDGFMVFSTESDPSLPAAKVTHEGGEAYSNIWQKIRSIWKYVYYAYHSHFDWFVLGGDDLFLIPSNLRAYLKSQEIIDATSGGTKPVFLGRRFMLAGYGILYNSGGAGYVMNRLALKILVENLDSDACMPKHEGFEEDVLVAYCLEAARGVKAYDTRDHPRLSGLPAGTIKKGTRERFHPFWPGYHLVYRYSGEEDDWYKDYNPWGLGEGYECCSDLSVSFHYVKPGMMERLSALLWDCRERNELNQGTLTNSKNRAANEKSGRPNDGMFRPTHTQRPTDAEIKHLTWPPPDPRQLTRQRLAVTNSSQKPQEYCAMEGLRGGSSEDRELLDSLSVAPANEDGRTLLCVVYTVGERTPANISKENPDERLASPSTWGPYCDGFVVFPSNLKDSTLPYSVFNASRKLAETDSMHWNKLRSILKYVYWAYSSHYDWVFLGDDEIFLIVPNLRAYLKSDEIIQASIGGGKPLFLGRRFQIPEGPLMNSGGAGFALNVAALKVLVTHLDEPKCFPSEETVAADAYLSQCLVSSAGVLPHDTRDHTRLSVAVPGSGKENRERFHPFSPGIHLTRTSGEGIAPNQEDDWYTQYNLPWGLGLGYECCSEHSITFHVSREMMPHMSALLFDCRHS